MLVQRVDKHSFANPNSIWPGEFVHSNDFANPVAEECGHVALWLGV